MNDMVQIIMIIRGSTTIIDNTVPSSFRREFHLSRSVKEHVRMHTDSITPPSPRQEHVRTHTHTQTVTLPPVKEHVRTHTYTDSNPRH